MAQIVFPRRFFSAADLVIFLCVGSIIYGVVAISGEWRADYQPVMNIDLSLSALPLYSFFSTIRALVAYIISLLFTLVVGYAAAKSRKLERVIIPAIDILQSIPPLGFMPGLVLALIALFPKTNTGLELTAIILIFTGQVWNMTFSFYSSVKSLPSDYQEACTVMGLTWWQKLLKVELPFSAVNLVWNSVLSMAGGWFFLSAAEAFTLGGKNFRIPGVGSYMAIAVEQGNTRAMFFGVIAMILIILILDFFIWRPILSWVRRFRLEEIPGQEVEAPLMLMMFRESRFIRWIKYLIRRRAFRHRHEHPIDTTKITETQFTLPTVGFIAKVKPTRVQFLKFLEPVLWFASGLLVGMACWRLLQTLFEVPWHTWRGLMVDTLYTFMRVLGALAISSLWAIPAGIWLGLSARRVRIAQPLIQVMASFPAPMLYPIALAILFSLGMNINWGSMFLMIMGVQWYVLFNVLAGALRISPELGYTMSLMNTSRWDRWRVLYLPSVFPALVTGWVTAAGGAWNASMVSEYIAYKGNTLTAHGLGATIMAATDKADFHLLAASLTTMVIVVLTFNRTVWSKLYHLVQTRYRMD